MFSANTGACLPAHSLTRSPVSQTQHISPFRLLRPTTIHSILISSDRVWATLLALICNLFVIIASHLYQRLFNFNVCAGRCYCCCCCFFSLCVHNTTYGRLCECSTLYYPILSNQSSPQFKCTSIFR